MSKKIISLAKMFHNYNYWRLKPNYLKVINKSLFSFIIILFLFFVFIFAFSTITVDDNVENNFSALAFKPTLLENQSSNNKDVEPNHYKFVKMWGSKGSGDGQLILI